MNLTTEHAIIAVLLSVVVAFIAGAYLKRRYHPADAPAAHIFLDLETLGMPSIPSATRSPGTVGALTRPTPSYTANRTRRPCNGGRSNRSTRAS